jgi:hypothetical protein
VNFYQLPDLIFWKIVLFIFGTMRTSVPANHYLYILIRVQIAIMGFSMFCECTIQYILWHEEIWNCFALCASQTEPDLPPEEGGKWGLLDYLKFLSAHRMKAVIWKDFLWMWRNVPWVSIAEIMQCLDSMKMIYYSYVHSILPYGIIFWGNSHLSESILKFQKQL